MRNLSQLANSISSGDMSGSVTGNAISAVGAHGFFFEASWSGTTPIGTLYLEHATTSGGTYRTLYSWDVSGNSGSETLNYPNFMGGFVRARYAFTSGVGTLNVGINLKE